VRHPASVPVHANSAAWRFDRSERRSWATVGRIIIFGQNKNEGPTMPIRWRGEC
jgi:hypothetical protein